MAIDAHGNTGKVDVYSKEYREAINDETLEEGEDLDFVEHKAELTALEVGKLIRCGALSYTILIKDELNLVKPVVIDLHLHPDESGKLAAEIVDPDEVEDNYGIKIE